MEKHWVCGIKKKAKVAETVWNAAARSVFGALF